MTANEAKLYGIIDEITILPSSYIASDELPKRGKDYNDFLKGTLKMRQSLERELALSFICC